MRAPDVELLWWDGCPSTERALADVRDALRATGLDPASVRMREIKSDAEAAAAAFAGSPTILIDGADVDPPPEEEPVGLTCRVYRRRDGRIAPTPDPDDVREALRRAATRPKEATNDACDRR
jgi:hypothetical protein